MSDTFVIDIRSGSFYGVKLFDLTSDSEALSGTNVASSREDLAFLSESIIYCYSLNLGSVLSTCCFSSILSSDYGDLWLISLTCLSLLISCIWSESTETSDPPSRPSPTF